MAAKKYGIKTLWESEIEAFPEAVTKHHFPDIEQLGDITKINGETLQYVDIITCGSPCQDLSVAGKQEGLKGARSGLFRDAIRIVHDMRRASGFRYPRFVVWENVPGAFSSNKGLDFRAVLEEIAEAEIPMPEGGKWADAGLAELPTCDIAWRVLDAQYWGVPQRRRRIFLVADFAAERRCAGQILFEWQSLHGHIEESREARQGTSAGTESGTGGASVVRMRAGCAGGGKGPLVSRERSLTLAANTNDQVLFVPDKARSLTARNDGSPCVDRGPDIVAAGFKAGQSMAGSIGYEVEKAATLGAKMSGTEPTVAVYDMTHADEVMRKVPDGRAPTLNARMGTGGNQVPVVSYAIAGNTIDRQIQNGGNGKGVLEEKSYTLNTVDRHAVCVGNGQLDQARLSDKVGALNCMHDQQAVMYTDTVGALCADDHKGINSQYVDQDKCVIQKSVRRLTPTECERLQGLPDVKRCVAFDLQNERLVMIEWLGYQNINVLSAVEQCLKKQKRVGSAESDKLQQSVSFAGKNLQPSNQSISKRVQKNARIFSEESDQETRSLLEKLRTVCNVDENLEYHRRNQTTNFVPQNAPINLTQENIVHNGEEGLQQKEGAIPQEDFGNTSLKEFGRERDVLAKGAEKYLMDMDGGLLFTMFDLTETAKKQDMMKKILSYFVQSVTHLHIQNTEQIAVLLLEPKGYTLIDDKTCSDTARYKALGNAMAMPCAEYVIRRIVEVCGNAT